MHNNYFFLRQVSARLNERLTGFTLVSCFSQSKDELVIEFNDSKSSFFIRASFLPEFCCLMFPQRFARARKNSIDLFNEILMKKVTSVTQYLNERSFSIHLEQDYSLFFKMHGNQSNVLLVQNDEVKDIFKRSLVNDLKIDPNQSNRQIDWSKESFIKNMEQPEKLYFTFGKPVWAYLKSKGFNEADVEGKWQLLQSALKILNNPTDFYLIDSHLSLLKSGAIDSSYKDPLEAVTNFCGSHSRDLDVAKNKRKIADSISAEIKSHRNYIRTASERLAEIETDEHFKAWGDILMANLHAIRAGAKSAELPDFYSDNKQITIPLDERLSPQKNAERYYRKGKNRTIEIDKLKQAIASRQKDLDTAQAKYEALNAQTDATLDVQLPGKGKEKRKSSPFWEFEFKGYTILAGKDATSNDELTTKWMHKNDLWLHARDVPGSHVVLRHKPGKNFPKDVIEYAAGIAAYNSKRKNETLCPVIVARKAYVRKRKGSAPGEVTVDREEVIMVEPRKV